MGNKTTLECISFVLKYHYGFLIFKDLEAKLQEAGECRTRLIATDGVFSMDGNVAPLPEICDLAEKYDALVFIDECHATGFLGQSGRGTEEFFGETLINHHDRNPAQKVIRQIQT